MAKIPMTGETATTFPYVAGLRCSIGHGGNRGLYRISRDSHRGFECGGCGEFYTFEFVCEAVAASHAHREHSLIAAR